MLAGRLNIPYPMQSQNRGVHLLIAQPTALPMPALPCPAARAVLGPQGAVHRHCGQRHRDVPAHVWRARLHAGLRPAHPVQLVRPGEQSGRAEAVQCSGALALKAACTHAGRTHASTAVLWEHPPTLCQPWPCCMHTLLSCPPAVPTPIRRLPPSHPITRLQNVTWEGENSVMYLQTARYLIKSALAVQAGKPLTGSAQYLATAAQQVRGRRQEAGRAGGTGLLSRGDQQRRSCFYEGAACSCASTIPQPNPNQLPPTRRASSAAWPPPATGAALRTCWLA